MSFLLPVDGKKINRTKFEIEEENTKLQIARKPPWYPLLFRLLNDRQENLSNLSNFEGFHESKMKKIKGLTELSLGVSLFLWSLSLIAKAILLIFPTANDSPNLAQRLLTVFFTLKSITNFF